MASLRAHSAKRSLQLETLEGRHAMAAITASLAGNGTFTVQGTAGNDQIQISLVSNKISVSGVKGTFDATKIKAITINTLAGNDTVSFKGFTTVKVPWNKPITINNSAGNDQIGTIEGLNVALPTGKYTRSNNGAQAVNGQSIDWFDNNIRDAALRSLLKSDFTDSMLDRREMLQLFTQIAQDHVVSADEFADLKAVAGKDSLFTGVEYVGVLTKNVALGNAANATYQGTTLGNLTSGANSSQLDKLVNKWFLGLDRPTATYGGTTYAYATARGNLFGSGGPAYGDVHQGALGDCYFLATLGETALRSASSITSMFIVNGDGTYTVRFFNGGKADYVTVDSQLPVDQWGRFVFANMGSMANSSSNVLWVALAEKAYVQINQTGWLRTGLPGNGLNSYQAIAGGYFSQAVSQIANKSSTTSAVTGSTFATFKTAFDAGKMVAFASMSTPGASNVVGGHQYVVVSYNASAQTVTLFNPWGLNNGSSYPGLITMTWSSLASSFSYWDRA
jgi:hypothetical protein